MRTDHFILATPTPAATTSALFPSPPAPFIASTNTTAPNSSCASTTTTGGSHDHPPFGHRSQGRQQRFGVPSSRTLSPGAIAHLPPRAGGHRVLFSLPCKAPRTSEGRRHRNQRSHSPHRAPTKRRNYGPALYSNLGRLSSYHLRVQARHTLRLRSSKLSRSSRFP